MADVGGGKKKKRKLLQRAADSMASSIACCDSAFHFFKGTKQALLHAFSSLMLSCALLHSTGISPP